MGEKPLAKETLLYLFSSLPNTIFSVKLSFLGNWYFVSLKLKSTANIFSMLWTKILELV
jgi:hypothetical protein